MPSNSKQKKSKTTSRQARTERPPPSASLRNKEVPTATMSGSVGAFSGDTSKSRLLSQQHQQQQQPHPSRPAAAAAAVEDPLSPPPTPHLKYSNHNSNTTNNNNNNNNNNNEHEYQVQMTEAQLRAALDRFGLEMEPDEDENPVLVAAAATSSLSSWWRSSSPPHSSSRQTNSRSSSSSCGIIAGAVACLCSATLGAGILSLPYAMAEAGMIGGMLLLVASAGATALSIQLLVQAMQVVYFSSLSTQQHYHRMNNNNDNNSNATTTTTNEKTYEDLVEICLGKMARRFVEASMLIFCCGGAVAYVIAVGDILQQSGWTISTVTNNTNTNNNIGTGVARAFSMTLVWTIAMVPLSLLRTMKSLQCTSSIGIASITTLVLAALYHYVEHHYNYNGGGDDSSSSSSSSSSSLSPTMSPVIFPNSSHFWSDGHNNNKDDLHQQSIFLPTGGILSILRACPIILFAFSCQVNVCAIYDEMPQSVNRPTSNNNANTSSEQTPTIMDDDEERPATTTRTQQQQQQQDTRTNNYYNASAVSSKYQRMILVTWLAVGICALLYSSISIIALLDFGSTKMTPNILSRYNPESVMQVAFVGMAIAVVLAYPMNIFPARATLLGIVREKQQQRQQQQRQQQRQQRQETPSSALPASAAVRHSEQTDHNDLTEPLLSPSSELGATAAAPELELSGNRQHSTMTTTTAVSSASAVNSSISDSDSLMEHILATFFLTGLSLGLALVAPNISVVFGLLGGTTSSVLGFVIPGLLGYKTAEDFYRCTTTTTTATSALDDNVSVDQEHAIRRKIAITRFLSMMLAVTGILIGFVTTGVTVYSTLAVPS